MTQRPLDRMMDAIDAVFINNNVPVHISSGTTSMLNTRLVLSKGSAAELNNVGYLIQIISTTLGSKVDIFPEGDRTVISINHGKAKGIFR